MNWGEFLELEQLVYLAILPGQAHRITDAGRRRYKELRGAYAEDVELMEKFGLRLVKQETLDALAAAWPRGPRSGDHLYLQGWSQGVGQYLMQRDRQSGPEKFKPTAWTGIETPTDRAETVKRLVPAAQTAIEVLTQEVRARGGNGGRSPKKPCGRSSRSGSFTPR